MRGRAGPTGETGSKGIARGLFAAAIAGMAAFVLSFAGGLVWVLLELNRTSEFRNLANMHQMDLTERLIREDAVPSGASPVIFVYGPAVVSCSTGPSDTMRCRVLHQS